MDEMAERFEDNRAHLRTVAYRMLGSRALAEDAVQEAWLRLNRSDVSDVDNLRGWLTTVVARVCLDMLRAQKSRREDSLEDLPAPIAERESEFEHETELADGVGLALLVVLQTLAPAERVAFVLHDMFDLPFDQIAPIVGRSPIAARQLASRARRRVHGSPATPDADRARQQEIVAAFLAASRGGDFGALLAVLDPGVVLKADAAAVHAAASRKGAPLASEIRGAAAVAEVFKGRAQAAKLALVNGLAGAVWAPGGKPRAVLEFAIEGGKIAQISVLADPESIRRLDIAIPGA